MITRVQVTAERGGRYEKHAISRYDDNMRQKMEFQRQTKKAKTLGDLRVHFKGKYTGLEHL